MAEISGCSKTVTQLNQITGCTDFDSSFIILIVDTIHGETMNIPVQTMFNCMGASTDTYTTGATLDGTTLILTRNDGVSYSADLSSLLFSGFTSGTCINDLYTLNIHSCSTIPITLWNPTQNDGSIASGLYSNAFGNKTEASGNYSFSEGYETSAKTQYSHAEGYLTKSWGNASHTEGIGYIDGGGLKHYVSAFGDGDHAEGWGSIANGLGSHAEGYATQSLGWGGSHSEGQSTRAYGDASHAEGYGSISINRNSHAEGYFSIARGDNSHAEGFETRTSGDSAHSEGIYTTAIGDYSHAGGFNSVSSGNTSFVHSSNSTCYHDNSAIIGGENMVSLTGNTTYVQRLEIVENIETAFIMKDIADGLRYKITLNGGVFVISAV